MNIATAEPSVSSGSTAMAASKDNILLKGTQTIASRFGVVTIDIADAFYFEHGLYGLEHQHRYCLSSFPVAKFPQFQMMQCVDDHTLSFVVLPLSIDNDLIDRSDIDAALGELSLSAGAVSLYLVVSVARHDNRITMTANTRAPIILNNVDNSGVQHVLTTGDYHVQHALAGRYAQPVQR